MSQITISEALTWQKVLKERHAELTELRNSNTVRTTRLYGANADRTQIVEVLYDAKVLDKTITRLAAETRNLDNAIKRINATTIVAGYNQDDSVLGELEMKAPTEQTEGPGH